MSIMEAAGFNEESPEWKAIDAGGGQACDIAGVLRALDEAGFTIAPKSALRASAPQALALPEIPDDDADFTPDLARKIIAKYQQLLRAAPPARSAATTDDTAAKIMRIVRARLEFYERNDSDLTAEGRHGALVLTNLERDLVALLERGAPATSPPQGEVGCGTPGCSDPKFTYGQDEAVPHVEPSPSTAITKSPPLGSAPHNFGERLPSSNAATCGGDTTPRAATPTRQCTCHPDDNPPVTCAQKYAYSDCVAAAPDQGVREALWPLNDRQLWDEGCITRAQTKHWTDGDLSQHAAGIRKTLLFLFDRLDKLAALSRPAPDAAGSDAPVSAFGMMKANGDLLPCAVAEEDAIYHMCAPMFDVSAEHVRAKLEGAGWHTVRVLISMDPTDPLPRHQRGSEAQ